MGALWSDLGWEHWPFICIHSFCDCYIQGEVPSDPFNNVA